MADDVYIELISQPTTLAELALPAVYQQTAKGEQFLLYDSGKDDVHRFLIFGTQRNLRMLRQSKISLADGTFKTAPPLFAQVYVMHGLPGDDAMKTGHLLPSLFVLLPNKTEDTYRRMWEQIRLLCPLAQPEKILLGFEKGAINSFEHVWPNIVVKCCFFHLTHDEELAIRIRKISALAFALPADVPNLFGQVAFFHIIFHII
ncbi:MULE and FLYWCH domain containing protein [Oopsacas minuta]|uniref:MULE and FLYWCH domain containing protein n=1 Tax=Oopsacas minuta TaxID=111878 RepID=A0AAV7JLM9_9METZ|nr:MULE and FLYWCH domain containing protein [Oopsacas minuta]